MRLNRKELKKNLILLIITIFIMLILFEIFLRLFYPQKIYNKCYGYTNLSDMETEYNTHFGWILKSNYSGCSYQPDTNKIIFQTHNSKGVRLDKEIQYGRGNKKRVILLGDSFVYGIGLNDSEIIATKLQENLGEEFEVIPMASGGYTTAQELLLLKEEGLKYHPDIVILFFYQNDLPDTPSSGSKTRPSFELINGTPILYNYPINITETIYWEKLYDQLLSREKPFSIFMLKYSHLYSLLYHTKIKLHLGLFSEDFYLQDGLVRFIERKYSTNTFNDVFLVIKLFDEFEKISEENNFEFMIVNIPMEINVNEKYQKKEIDKYRNFNEFSLDFRKTDTIFNETLPIKNAIYDYPIWDNAHHYYYNEEIYISNYSIHYISLFDLAKNNFKDFYFKSDSHWSPYGVKLSADYITEKLREKKII